MQGHLHKRGRSWGWVVDVGRDPATGKRRQKTKSGFRTKAEAERALRELLDRLESGNYVADSAQPLAEYLDQWLGTARPNLRPDRSAGPHRSSSRCSQRRAGSEAVGRP